MQKYKKYLNQIVKSPINLSTKFELLLSLYVYRKDDNLINGETLLFF